MTAQKNEPAQVSNLTKKRFFRKLTQMEKYLITILLGYILLVSFVNKDFFQFSTLFDLIKTSAGTMILASGVLMVIISGGIDVSFTAIAVVGGYSSIKLMMALGIDNLFFAFVISAVIGIFLGAINAVLIHHFKLPTLIVTLGTSSIFYGFMVTFVGTKSISVANKPKSLLGFGNATLFSITQGKDRLGLTVFVLFIIAVIALTWFILYRTMLGRSIFALGNSEESATRVGINVFLTRLFVYTYMGFLSGIMGIIYFSEIDLINPISLVGTELMIIAAVVIGGIKLSGGDGTILGAMLGVMIIQIFQSTLVFLGLSTSWNNFFVGIILIASISVIYHRARVNNRKKLIFRE